MVCIAARNERLAAGASELVPALASDPANEAAPAKPAAARIWMVDDDPAVRSMLQSMLIRDGHELWETGDAREAVRRFADASPADRPDVILTDVIMPTMTGMRMVDQIQKISPDVKIIYMSGYVQSAIQWPGLPGSVVAFLEKPIKRETLLATVQRVVRTAPGGF
jgi:CheY-like chemotaxis protein